VSRAATAAAPAVPAVPDVRTDARFLVLGVYFGFVLTKSEAMSWYRVQEMFRFQSFHMYGLIGAAILVAMLSVWAIRRFGLRGVDGGPITFELKPPQWRRYAYGGVVFGVGWALAGACPGPLAVLIGAGLWPLTVVLAAALLGTYAYGALEKRLPH